MPLHAYEVGKLYNPNRTDWPQTPQYNYRGGEHELTLFYESPTRQEIRSAKKSPLHLALVVEQPLIILLFHAKGLTSSWSPAPYSWHMIPEDQRTTPPTLSESERPILHLLLVRADGGQLLAQRVLSFPPDFGQILHSAIRDQAERPWDPGEYQSRVNQLFAQYPDDRDLLDLAVARGQAGT